MRENNKIQGYLCHNYQQGKSLSAIAIFTQKNLLVDLVWIFLDERSTLLIELHQVWLERELMRSYNKVSS